MKLTIVMTGLVTMGAVNFVLLKMVYAQYSNVRVEIGADGQGKHESKYKTVDLSFFANQGINFLYVIYGGMILYPRMLFTDAIPKKMRESVSQKKFMVMGFLDACGTFLTSLGAGATPGELQPVLNQTLIPYTIIVSHLYMGARYHICEKFGAFLIVCGAVLSTLSSDSADSSSSGFFLLFWFKVSKASFSYLLFCRLLVILLGTAFSLRKQKQLEKEEKMQKSKKGEKRNQKRKKKRKEKKETIPPHILSNQVPGAQRIDQR